jgi:hypothetical protein
MQEPFLGCKVAVELSDFPWLFDVLKQHGYRVVGPSVREGAIVYDELPSVSDLPIGLTDEQDGGTYRLRRRDDQALFGYVVGPHSWKKFLHPPVARLLQATRTADGFQIIAENEDPPRFAFIGVRSCELHAISIQDRVFIGGQFTDPVYQARREQIFIVAVNCGQSGGTCFCVSMNTGPKATAGFDLALTEIPRVGGITSSSKQAQRKAGRFCASCRTRKRATMRSRKQKRSLPEPLRRWGGLWTPLASKSCSIATTNIRAGTTWPAVV